LLARADADASWVLITLMTVSALAVTAFTIWALVHIIGAVRSRKWSGAAGWLGLWVVVWALGYGFFVFLAWIDPGS